MASAAMGCGPGIESRPRTGQHAVRAAATLALHERTLGGEEAQDGVLRVEALLDVDKEEDADDVAHLSKGGGAGSAVPGGDEGEGVTTAPR